MDVLTRPFDPARPARGSVVPFPPRALVPFAVVGLAGAAAGRLGWAPPEIVRVLGVLGFHGGLVAVSMAAAWEGARGWGRPAALVALCLVIAAAACAVVTPWGCLAYLLPPFGVTLLACRRPEFKRMGLAPCPDWRAVALGVAVGAFLGGHLLFSASRTFGYPVRLNPFAPYLAGVLYDAGANVLSAECFFRGTLFNRWQRRWGFWAGALAATGLSVVRYLADPALPGRVEMLTGAVFYLALLSLSGCALLWHSGSLLPSLGAAFVFFSAYRMLRVW
jgi:hypothetical protein